MIVKNWMSKTPDIISSDVSAKKALEMFDEKKIPFMTVVDEGRFRGLIARRDLMEAASWAFASQDIHETQYFNDRLKVKDIMVRKPVTIDVNDSVEKALEKGKQFGRSYLPVMDGGRLVGTLSNTEFTYALNQVLGGDDHLHGVCIQINGASGPTLQSILEEIFKRGLQIKGVFTLKDPETKAKRMTIRFEEKFLKGIYTMIDEKGYNLIEVAG